MLALRFSIAIIAALIASLGIARGEEKPPDGRPFLRIEAGMHTAAIRRIAVSADGRLLATGSHDKTVRLWSIPDGRLLKTFRVPIGDGDDGKVFAVALSPDGRLLAAGGWDVNYRYNGDPLYIYLFDTVSGALVQRLGPLPNVVFDLVFAPDGQWLAAGLGRKNGIRLWGGAAGFAGAPLADTDYGGDVHGIDFDDKSRRMAVTSWDGDLRLYQMPGGQVSGFKLLERERAPAGELPYGIAFAPDGLQLAVGYDDSTAVSLLDAASLEPLAGPQPDTGFVNNGNLVAVAWSADGATLYAGGSYVDGTGKNRRPVIAWGAGGRGAPRPLGGPGNTVLDLATLPKGGVAWGGAGPAFGLFGQRGESVLVVPPVMADMRGKHSGHFWSAGNADAVWFGLEVWSEDPWRFDVARLAFEAAPTRPEGFIEPNTDKLKIENWLNAVQPILDGQVLQLEPYETSRSLAIAPDAKSFIIGAEWSIYRFKDNGEQWRVSIPGIAWGVNLSADGSVIVAALGDGTIRWYRALDGKELLAFFVHVPDKRWIAWTPSGYYAASAGGEDLIGWHVNGKTWDDPVDFFPASLFRDKFYRPDIVQLVLKTRDEAKAVAEANEIAKRKEEDAKLPAVVELLADPRGVETDKPQLGLKYRLRSPSGRSLTRLEVRIDGRPIDSKGIETFDEELALDTENSITVRIPPQDTLVSLIAYIGDQPSEAASVAVKWTGAKREGELKPKLTALFVGVSGYQIPDMAPLAFADDDARDLEKLLKGQENRLFSTVETHILTDGDATKNNILDGLTWLDQHSSKDGYALLFMSGHGVTDLRQKFYFLPIDANIAPEKLRTTAVTESEIKDVLSTIPGNVIFFIDACRSGASLDGLTRADATSLVNGLARDDAGIVMFASSSKEQNSLESPVWKNGAFSEALLEGLTGAADFNRNRVIDTAELHLYLRDRVPDLTNNLQNEVYRKPDLNKDMTLAVSP